MGLRDLFTRKPKASDVPLAVREVLFGDVPPAGWPPAGDVSEFPWSAFHEARGHLASGDVEAARRCWIQVTESPDLESLHYVQAWHFLREHGHAPPPHVAQRVYGTVVEYMMDVGLDIVAAYADHGARYYNHSGRAAIWLQGDGSLDGMIDQLLAASQQVVRQIGPWEGARPGPPGPGEVRLSFLTPSGLHFGQGPMNALAADPMGGPVIHAALQLMQALMEKSESAPPQTMN